jgi:hypothetical protein
VATPAPAPALLPAVSTVVSVNAKPVAPAASDASAQQPAAPLPTGTVKLAISPWGEVYEGRRSLGVTPPMIQLTLPVGKHTLTIRNGDAPPFRKTVDVKAGGAVNIEHQF